jgi:uncharacterized protein (UPF0332 family)
VTPEAENYLIKARDDLKDARKIVAIGLATVAARTAYYAAFYAAEAFIIDRMLPTQISHHSKFISPIIPK